MPITKTPAFQTSDGQTWPTLALAQRSELLKLVTAQNNVEPELANRVLDGMFDNLDATKQILSCTGRKPRKAGKGNGKPRRTRTNAAVKEAV